MRSDDKKEKDDSGDGISRGQTKLRMIYIQRINVRDEKRMMSD